MRPDFVHILTTRFSVLWLNEDEWSAANLPDDAIGQCDGLRAVIHIRAGAGNDEAVLRSTLLHEVLHACTQSSKFDKYMKDVEDGEEFFVAMLAPVLLSVLAENPGMVKYLAG